MGRTLRPYLPGSFFHLTARTQDRVCWFDAPEIKDRVECFIQRGLEECDVELICYVVMNNHIHVVARQHRDPVWRLMQSVLRRTSLLIRARTDVDGHIFSRRYAHRVCTSAAHLRTWIRYVHRNPIEAGYCTVAWKYKWSSDRHWRGVRSASQAARPRVNPLREIFGSVRGLSQIELCARYREYVDADTFPEERLPCAAADDHWDELCKSRLAVVNKSRRDLRDVIDDAIADICPDLDIGMLRVFRGTRISDIRKRMVVQAASAGYPGCEIARYLHVSESTVSRTIRDWRKRTPNIRLWDGLQEPQNRSASSDGTSC